MEEDADDAVLDAGLIAAAQRVEHYEITAYGTLMAWAKALGRQEALELLGENEREEKEADEKLSELAETFVNQQAASGGEEDEEDAQPAARGRSTSIRRSPSRPMARAAERGRRR
jgi:ferritin-like metal-binding protein YciE